MDVFFLQILLIFWCLKCGAFLRDLVPFLQFKKREKLPWRSVTFVTKVAAKYLQIY